MESGLEPIDVFELAHFDLLGEAFCLVEHLLNRSRLVHKVLRRFIPSFCDSIVLCCQGLLGGREFQRKSLQARASGK